MALMILAIYDRLGVKEAESFDHLHGLIEAAKRAIAVRDRVLTDPARLPHPLDRYLSPTFLDAEAAAIDRRKAAPWKAHEEWATLSGWAPPTRPVWSFLHPVALWEFGSGVVLPQTGIVMQNRA